MGGEVKALQASEHLMARLDRSTSDLWVNLFPEADTGGGLDLSGASSRERVEALVQYAVVEVRLAWPVPGSLSVTR